MIILIIFIYKFFSYLFINKYNNKYDAFIIFIIISNFSCSSILKKEYPQKKYFIITPYYEKATSSLYKTNNIKTLRVKISSFFEGKNFVYRQGENSYESDYYNEFLVFPAYNLNESISKWFSKSNPSETPSFESQDTTYLLTVIIESMYVDFRDEKNPKTNWEITFILQKNNEQNILFKKDYQIETRIDKITPENIIKSWNNGLTEILIQLQNDLLKISDQFIPEPEKPIKVIQKKKKHRVE